MSSYSVPDGIQRLSCGTQAEYALIPSEMAMTHPVHTPARAS
jgi:hypothetical protein